MKFVGLISKELVPHVKTVLGVDISQGVVDMFSKRFTQQGLAPEAIHAIREELNGAEDELEGRKFDVIKLYIPPFCPALFDRVSSVQ